MGIVHIHNGGEFSNIRIMVIETSYIMVNLQVMEMHKGIIQSLITAKKWSIMRSMERYKRIFETIIIRITEI